MTKKLFLYFTVVSAVLTLLSAVPGADAKKDETVKPKKKNEANAKVDLLDLNLMDCYTLALQQSETVAISKEEIERAEAGIFQATSDALGEVHFVASDLKQDAPQNNASGGTSVGSTLTQRDKPESKFVITQPLFQGFKSLGALTGAGSLRNQRKNEWLRAEQLLFLDVARSFYQVLRYQKDVQTIEEIKKSLIERISDLSEREKIGRSRASELATAKSELKLIEAELAKSKGLLLVEKQVLSFLIGKPFDQIMLVDQALTDITLPVTDYTAKLESRPDVEASKQALKLARKRLIVAQSDLWPSVSLEHNRYTHREGFQSDIDWDILFKVDVPLFKGGETTGKIKDAISLWKQAKWAHLRTKREAELDIKRNYLQWRTTKEQYEALRDSVYASEENFKLQKEDYAHNLVNNLDVLQALEQFYQSSRQANEVYYDMKLNFWRLQVASGQCCPET